MCRREKQFFRNSITISERRNPISKNENQIIEFHVYCRTWWKAFVSRKIDLKSVITKKKSIKNVKSKDSKFSKSWIELNQIREWSEIESNQRLIRNWFRSLSKSASLSEVLSNWTTMLEKENRYHQTNQNCRLRCWKKQTQTVSFETKLFWIQNTKNKKNKKSLQKNMPKKKKITIDEKK